jgi:hypothetical protein
MEGKPLMRARFVITAALVAAAVCDASGQGQGRTADGVVALARGDYQRAVEILKPIADDPWTEDTVAAFFMAGLYDTGRGVPPDALRACALYMRAGGNFEPPFEWQASYLFSATLARGQDFNEECQRLANVGFDSGFEPATFDLGPRHAVEWTLAAATVTYEDRRKRHPMPFAQRGDRILPLQHTELATGPKRALTRHFVEMFVWQPSGKSGPWTLRWHLFEVVRDEIVRIDTPDTLVTVVESPPPSRDAFDVREYAVVRVTDDGNTEWAVLKGPHRGTERIETDVERVEARETRLKRDTALKNVDWKRRSDVNRQPALTYADADGCGYVQVFGWTANRDEAVVVRAIAPDIWPATQAAVTFDLSRGLPNISLEVYVYDAPRRQFDFCSDVKFPDGPDAIGPAIWRAVAGTVSVAIAPGPSGPRATVTLTNVVLRNAAGATMRVPGPLRLTAPVGSVAG